MTVKEITLVAGCNKDTVIDTIKKLYPEKIQHGKKTILNLKESENIMRVLPKRNMVMENSNSQQMENSNSQQMENVVGTCDKYSQVEKLESLVISLAEIVKTQIAQTQLLINNQSQKQLEYKQDYFTILAYANLQGNKKMTVTEARALSFKAKNLSIAEGIEIRTVPDERWGTAKSYSVEILKKVFEI